MENAEQVLFFLTKFCNLKTVYLNLNKNYKSLFQTHLKKKTFFSLTMENSTYISLSYKNIVKNAKKICDIITSKYIIMI